MPRRKVVVVEDAAGRLAMSEAHYPHAEALMQQHVVGWVPARGQGTRGTDIIFAGSPRVAVRVRSFEAALLYREEFTVRTKPQDERLHLADVRYYLYGWAQPGWRHHEAPMLAAWAIIDWPAFRAALREGLAPIDERDNSDGSAFVAYGFADEYTLGAHLYVPTPTRGEGHPTFVSLPWGTCWVCHGWIINSEQGRLVKPSGPGPYVLLRQHASPCYSLEVP